jgi:hypothetical protein
VIVVAVIVDVFAGGAGNADGGGNEGSTRREVSGTSSSGLGLDGGAAGINPGGGTMKSGVSTPPL